MTTTPTSPPGFRDGIEAAAKEADSWEFSIWDTNNEQTHTSREVEAMVADHRRSVVEAIRAIPTPDTLPTGWNSDMGAAPRDGTAFLVVQATGDISGPVMNVVYWDIDNPRYPWRFIDGDSWYRLDWPTHWMPLPPPPGE